jgi:hypothetical protein
MRCKFDDDDARALEGLLAVRRFEFAVDMICRLAKEKELCIRHLNGRCRMLVRGQECQKKHWVDEVCPFEDCNESLTEYTAQGHFYDHWRVLNEDAAPYIDTIKIMTDRGIIANSRRARNRID